MGTEYHTALNVSKLTPAKPNAVRDAVLRSGITDSDLTGELMGAMLSGFNVKARRLINYAEKNFSDGLPFVYLKLDRNQEYDIIQAIAADNAAHISADIRLINVSSRLGASNEDVVRHHLKDSYGWSDSSNLLVSSIFYDHWELSPRKDKIHIYDTDGNVFEVIDFADPETNYLVVKWEDITNTSSIHTWVYDTSTSSYPNLDANLSGIFTDRYFPIMSIRHDDVSVNEDKESARYKTTKKALKYLGIDVDELLVNIETGIEESATGNSNEDVEWSEVDEIFITMSGNVYSKEVGTMRYFLKYFQQVYDLIQREDPNKELDSYKIKYEEEDFDTGLVFSAIQNRVDTGNIADFLDGEVKDKKTDGARVSGIISGDDGKAIAGDIVRELIPFTSSIVWLEQIDANSYKRVAIFFAEHQTSIYKKDFAGLEQFSRHTYKITTDTDDGKQEGFILPISYNVMKQLSREEENELCYDCLNIVMYIRAEVEVKWWQTGLFQTFVQIVGWVLAIYTAGQSLVIAAATSASAVAMVVLNIIISTVVIDYAIQWIYENIDSETIRIILSVALAIVASGKLNDIVTGIANATAKTLVDLVTIIGDTLSALNSFELAQIQEEYGVFKEEYEKELDELEELRDSLGLNENNAPLYMIQDVMVPRLDASESPNNFFNRTLNTNPGVDCYNLVQDYVDMALTLPEIK